MSTRVDLWKAQLREVKKSPTSGESSPTLPDTRAGMAKFFEAAASETAERKGITVLQAYDELRRGDLAPLFDLYGAMRR